MAKIYEDIITLPFKIFRQCILTGDLKGLIISGRVPKKKLNAAWKSIKDEYFDLMASPQSKRYLKVQTEISSNVSRKKLIKTLTELLISEWENDTDERKRIVDLLNGLVQTKFAFKNIEDIKRVLKRSNFIDLKIKILQSELEELEKKLGDEGEKPSFKYFTNTLITLGDFSKYQISEDITTFEYCERLRRYTKFVKDASSTNRRR